MFGVNLSSAYLMSVYVVWIVLSLHHNNNSNSCSSRKKLQHIAVVGATSKVKWLKKQQEEHQCR